MTSGKVIGIQPLSEFRKYAGSAKHASYASRPRAKVRSVAAFLEIQEHLANFYGEVEAEHSFLDSAGQIFDCIPLEQQASLRLKKQTAKKAPVSAGKSGSRGVSNPAPRAPLREGRLDHYGNLVECPDGCVPIRRITLDQLTRFETLRHYQRKGSGRPPKANLGAPAAPDAPGAGSQQHVHAFAAQGVANFGGHSILNVWNPVVDVSASGSEAFSLSQIWCVHGSGASRQTVEAGWQCCPSYYGYGRPALFTYWTNDGYATGAYDSADFVQVSSGYAIGQVLDSVSQADGVQGEIEIAFHLVDDAWWLLVGGTEDANHVGYYPTSLFPGPGLATGADTVEFGGETYASTTIYPPMGSGALPGGGYKESAYHRAVSYFDQNGALQDANLLGIDESAIYQIQVDGVISSDWGSSFYFGGPGGAFQPLPASD